jgi:hypothetical protein
MVLMQYSGARGTLIYEKKLMSKISFQTPFKNGACNAAILKVPIRENFDFLFLHVHHQNVSLGIGELVTGQKKHF